MKALLLCRKMTEKAKVDFKIYDVTHWKSNNCNVVHCAIRYHLHNLKNVENTQGGVLVLVKLQASAWNHTKINTPPWYCRNQNIFRFSRLLWGGHVSNCVGILPQNELYYLIQINCLSLFLKKYDLVRKHFPLFFYHGRFCNWL